MSAKYYRAKIPWLQSEFLFKRDKNDLITPHFIDNKKFCGCSFTKEDCVDKNFTQEVGPCPKCNIKCVKHIGIYGIQSDSNYIKLYSENNEKYRPCIFCQYETTGEIDENMIGFFITPYDKEPAISFLSKNFLHDSESTLDEHKKKFFTTKINTSSGKGIICRYQGRDLIDPFCVLKTIGMSLPYKKRTNWEQRKLNSVQDVRIGVKQRKEEIPDLPKPNFPNTLKLPDTPRPTDTPKQTETPRHTLTQSSGIKKKGTHRRPIDITNELYRLYINNYQALITKYTMFKNTVPKDTLVKVLVGLISDEKDIIFKISDYGNMLEEQLSIIEMKEKYEVDMTNRATSFNLTSGIISTKTFKEETELDTDRIIVIRLMEKVEGMTIPDFLLYVVPEETIIELSSLIFSEVLLMHSLKVYHGDLYGRNILIELKGNKKAPTPIIRFIDFTYRIYFRRVNNLDTTFTIEGLTETQIIEMKAILKEAFDIWVACFYIKRDYKHFIVHGEKDKHQNINDPETVYYLSKVFGNFFTHFARYIFKVLKYRELIKELNMNLYDITFLFQSSLNEIGTVFLDRDTDYTHIIENGGLLKKSVLYGENVNYLTNIENFLKNGDGFDPLVSLIVTLVCIGESFNVVHSSEGMTTSIAIKFEPSIDYSRRPMSFHH